MPDLDDVQRFLSDDHGLAVVSTVQSDGRVLSSVVNAGVMAHPTTGADSVAFVSAGSAARLGHVRRGSAVTVAVQRGWRWVAVTGAADLVGPDDTVDGIEIAPLLRTVFRAAGGSHDDWDEYDRVMAQERRTAVFVEATRILGVV